MFVSERARNSTGGREEVEFPSSDEDAKSSSRARRKSCSLANVASELKMWCVLHVAA